MKINPARLLTRWWNQLTYQPSDAETVHNYWAHPWDGANKPKNYAAVDPKRSFFLVKLVKKYIPSTESRIMEFGPNVGRNLHYLQEAGYTKLSGVEISRDAVAEMGKTYPDLRANVQVNSIEDMITTIPDDAYDLGYSMAVLQHVPYTSDWVFPHIARTCKTVITIENEWEKGWRHYPRNYQRVFEPHMRQVESGKCLKTGLDHYHYRVFSSSSS